MTIHSSSYIKKKKLISLKLQATPFNQKDIDIYLEVLVPIGKIRNIRQLAGIIKAFKGIKHGELVII